MRNPNASVTTRAPMWIVWLSIPVAAWRAGNAKGRAKPAPTATLFKDERQRERGVPLLDRRLIGDDRVPRGQERAFPNPRDDRGGGEPPEVRRGSGHEQR